MQKPVLEERAKVYHAIALLFKSYKKPVKKQVICEETGLDESAVHLALVWLKRWKLIHNNGKSKRKWFPIKIPRAGVCWDHGDRIKNGICETCERVEKYTYSKKRHAIAQALSGVSV